MGIKQKEENTNSGLHNTLAAGTTVKGNIITETDFRLDGIIEGDVNCSGKIVIGPKGKVTGNIISANAEILGESGRYYTCQCQTCPKSNSRHQRRHYHPNSGDRTERPFQRSLQDVR